jgi:hypothetical protein
VARQPIPRDRLISAGHRIVHGGALYTGPVHIDATVIGELRCLIPLPSLHQPHHLAAVAALSKLQIACFDTSFHQTPLHVATAGRKNGVEGGWESWGMWHPMKLLETPRSHFVPVFLHHN